MESPPFILEAIRAFLPWIAIAMAGLATVIAAGLGLVRPRWMAYAFLLVLFTVTGSSFGRVGDSGGLPMIYSRGSGQLYLSFFDWAQVAALVWALIANRMVGVGSPRSNLIPWFGGWLALLFGHVVAGVSVGVPLGQILTITGFPNFVLQGVLVLLVLAAFRTREDLDELLKAIVVVVLLRVTYGLLRFVLFEGDPANVYANFNRIAIRLTFFDLTDSLICVIAMAIAGYRLFGVPESSTPTRWRSAYWAVLVLCGLSVLLSYRRSAWLGLVAAMLVLLAYLPARKRLQLGVLSLPPLLAGLSYVIYKRVMADGAGNVLQRFFEDIRPTEVGRESDRLLELRLGFEAFLDHPVFGLGAWGRYANATLIDWQTGEGAGSFVHSGVLHVAMKTGMVGLLLLAGLLTAFVVAARRIARSDDPLARTAAIAGMAGVAFTLPELLIAPLNYRLGQVTALCMALPYLGAQVSEASRVRLAALVRMRSGRSPTGRAGGSQHLPALSPGGTVGPS